MRPADHLAGTGPLRYHRRKKERKKKMKDLIVAYLAAKNQENIAKQARLKVEAALVAAVGNDKLEGTKGLQADIYKVSVVNKLTRTLDIDQYMTVRDTLPESLQFVDLKPTINLTKLRHLEAIDPDIAAKCITVKPAKPSITIKEIEL